MNPFHYVHISCILISKVRQFFHSATLHLQCGHHLSIPPVRALESEDQSLSSHICSMLKTFPDCSTAEKLFFEILIFCDIRLAFTRHSFESCALSSGSSRERSSGETILSGVSVSTTLFFCLYVFITLINGGCRPQCCVCKMSQRSPCVSFVLCPTSRLVMIHCILRHFTVTVFLSFIGC